MPKTGHSEEPIAHSMAIESRLRSRKVVAERGAPVSISADNGSEFAGKAMDAWSYCRSACPDG